jgi:hypothetical protein
MDTEVLQENKNVLAAAAVGFLIVLAAGLMMTGPDASNPQDTDSGPDTPEEPATPGENESDTDDTSSSPDSGSESRFTSVEKSYEVLEIDGVGDEVAVRASTGENEILELGGEVVANETVIPEFRGVDGELYYVMSRNGSKYVFNEEEDTVSEGYSMITSLRDVNGELTMTVQESLMPSYIVRDGEKIGQDYYEAKWPSWVNGELAYKAVGGTQNLIVHGGEEQERYDETGFPIEAEGKLTYRVQQGNTEFIKHGDERLASNYSSIEGIWQSEGSLTYVANQQGELKLMRDGEDILEDEWQLHPDSITWIDGNLAYFVTTGNDERLVYDGEVIGEEFNIQHSNNLIANVNGKIAFAAKQDGSWVIVKEN